MTCKVKMIWDDYIWHCETDDEVGVTLHSGSFDALVERVKMALPEMLELNFGYTGPVKIVFETEHIVVTRGLGEDGGLYEEGQNKAVLIEL